jgi:hypothetical protein
VVWWERSKKYATQRGAVDLRTVIASSIAIEQQGAMLIVQSVTLIFRPCFRTELGFQVRQAHRALSGLGMQIERSALGAFARMRITLKYGRMRAAPI